MRSPKETADIISFYNVIFIPTMENFLLQFQMQHDEENTAPTSPSKYVASLPPHSPKVITNSNLYLSPMRGARSTSLIAHSNLDGQPAKFSFSVGESPARVVHYYSAKLT
jgi:hypothetical protein